MKKKKVIRIFEIIPGTLVWLTFILGIVLSFIRPLWVIYFIIIFSLFWLFKVVYFIFFIIASWRRHKRDLKIHWMEKVENIKGWNKLYHLVVLPTSTETFEVLDTTFDGLANADYPIKEKMIVVLSGEERSGVDRFEKIVSGLKEKYEGTFFKILFTIHPDNLVGEIKGKGANAHWAGHKCQELIDELGIPYENVVVSYFDSDTIAHKQYFSYLAYKYLTAPDPTKTSYQPIVLFNNNIWDAPAFTRVIAFGTVFWLMTELLKPEKLFTFSSHSMSFKALVDVGFWQKDIVTDDSRIFLQCFVHYQGNYSVTPLYIPVSMDTVMADTYWKTLKNLYLQQRRWAWGVEHIPYMVWNFFFVKNTIPLYKKIRLLYFQTEGMYSWATAPIILVILGRLPLWVVSNSEKTKLVVQNAPYTLDYLMSVAMIGIFISAAFSVMLLPPKPKSHPTHRFLTMIFQWLFLPVALILFGSIPATEAQTRLMFGKYLGFWVTEKTRK